MKEKIIVQSIKRIIFVGAKEYPERQTSFSPKLAYNELIYHFTGEANIRFGQEVLRTQPDSIRFLPAGEWDRYDVERIVHGECIDIVFQSNEPLFDKAVIFPANNEKIKGYFKKIFSLWVGKGESYEYECISVLYKILAEIKKTHYLSKEQFALLSPAVEFIKSNFLTEKITAEDLSKICGISYSYIKKLFTLKFGLTPKKYLLHLKINYAADLLKHGGHTVQEIAELCGYTDVYFFSRQFKQHLGLSPTAFIKKYQSSK